MPRAPSTCGTRTYADDGAGRLLQLGIDGRHRRTRRLHPLDLVHRWLRGSEWDVDGVAPRGRRRRAAGQRTGQAPDPQRALALRTKLLAAGNKTWTAVPARGRGRPAGAPARRARSRGVRADLDRRAGTGLVAGGRHRPGRQHPVGDGRSASVIPTGCTCSAATTPPAPRSTPRGATTWSATSGSSWRPCPVAPAPRSPGCAPARARSTWIGGAAATDNHLIYNVAANTWSVASPACPVRSTRGARVVERQGVRGRRPGGLLVGVSPPASWTSTTSPPARGHGPVPPSPWPRSDRCRWAATCTSPDGGA